MTEIPTRVDPTLRHRSPRTRAAPWALLGAVAVALATASVVPSLALAQEMQCTKTSFNARRSGYNEAREELYATLGTCQNLSEPADRVECKDEARDEQDDARRLVYRQFRARQKVCGLVGEAPYDPDLDAIDFVDPADIGGSVDPNPYFPLVPGNVWVYENEEETITVTVTDETKVIRGVTTVVVTDIVALIGNDEPIEETDDWYAQDSDGNVWYLGEIALNYENGELVDIEGSWETGRDGAKAGIVMPADPVAGDAYRQEFLLTEAEDVGEVLSVTGSETVPEGTSCSGDCLITKDFTPIEPGVAENKYYAPGVGLILEIDPDDPEDRTELVEFTTE